jgi:heptosyltransferase-2
VDTSKNILIIAWGGIGDIVCLSPALLALRNRYPRANVTILCENDAPYKLISNWGEVATLCMKEKKFQGLSGKIQMIKTIRSLCVGTATMNAVGPSLRSAIIFLLSGAKIRIGKNIRGRGFLNTIKFTEYRMHEIDANFQIFKFLGVEKGNEKPFVRVPKESFQFVSEWCRDRKILPKEVIGIHPGAGDEKRRWDKFGELMRLFIEKKEKLVVFGIETEKDYIESIIRNCWENLQASTKNNNIFPFIGYPINYTSAMIANCKVFIGNDSGLAHIASALSIPTAAIFGPASWERSGPYGNKSVIVKSDLPCSPCSWTGVRIRCKSLECLKRIKVEDVYREAEKLMEGRRA